MEEVLDIIKEEKVQDTRSNCLCHCKARGICQNIINRTPKHLVCYRCPGKDCSPLKDSMKKTEHNTVDLLSVKRSDDCSCECFIHGICATIRYCQNYDQPLDRHRRCYKCCNKDCDRDKVRCIILTDAVKLRAFDAMFSIGKDKDCICSCLNSVDTRGTKNGSCVDLELSQNTNDSVCYICLSHKCRKSKSMRSEITKEHLITAIATGAVERAKGVKDLYWTIGFTFGCTCKCMKHEICQTIISRQESAHFKCYICNDSDCDKNINRSANLTNEKKLYDISPTLSAVERRKHCLCYCNSGKICKDIIDHQTPNHHMCYRCSNKECLPMIEEKRGRSDVLKIPPDHYSRKLPKIDDTDELDSVLSNSVFETDDWLMSPESINDICVRYPKQAVSKLKSLPWDKEQKIEFLDTCLKYGCIGASLDSVDAIQVMKLAWYDISYEPYIVANLFKGKKLYYDIEPSVRTKVVNYLVEMECDLVSETVKLCCSDRISFYKCLTLETKIHRDILKKLIEETTDTDIIINMFDGKPGFEALFVD